MVVSPALLLEMPRELLALKTADNTITLAFSAFAVVTITTLVAFAIAVTVTITVAFALTLALALTLTFAVATCYEWCVVIADSQLSQRLHHGFHCFTLLSLSIPRLFNLEPLLRSWIFLPSNIRRNGRIS